MINNYQDIIDSRDVMERIDELESIIEDAGDTDEELCKFSDEIEELKSLKALAEQASDSPDWKYGEGLIRESYFEDYARELAEDCGMISGEENWPLNCIDWEEAADQLKVDYFDVDFGGVSYYIRA